MTEVTPYSLGKLIDWKQGVNPVDLAINRAIASPYSLGKLIDWKPLRVTIKLSFFLLYVLPTR